MRPDILIPFESECEHRTRNLAHIWQSYTDAGYTVILGRSDPHRWSKAEAVADALTLSRSELIVIADADCWSDQLHDAIAAVEQGAPWASPYTQVWRLTDIATQHFIDGERSGLEVFESHRPMRGGGIVCIARDNYERVPLDPRFIGWGGEDLAWGIALAELIGEGVMVPGRCWHLWHPTPARRDRIRGSIANTALAVRYGDAQHDPVALGALIEEATTCPSRPSTSRPPPSSIPA